MSVNENTLPDAMLDSVAALIREFPVCDDHQLSVLTLWVLHTWFYQASPTTSYLHIHSPEPECGKTTCLQLLKILSCRRWISSGPDPAALTQRLIADSTFQPCGVGPLGDDLHPVTGVTGA